MSHPSLPVPVSGRTPVYLCNNLVGDNPLDFNGNDFTITELNNRLDIALTKVLQNNEALKAKKADTTLKDLIKLNTSDRPVIGTNLEFVEPATARVVTWANQAGTVYPHTNYIPSETGLSAARTFQFPNESTRLMGMYNALPMGFTDYQWGSCVGGDATSSATFWGEGLLRNPVATGATLGTSISSGAKFRTFQTGAVANTRAGEKSGHTVTRRSLSPILWGRILLTSANTDTRWFFGFSDDTDIPTGTDTPLANAEGFGIVIDDQSTGTILELHSNAGDATSTETNIIATSAEIENVWAYFVLDCDEKDDVIRSRVWTGTEDGSPHANGIASNPTYTDTLDFTDVPASSTALRYHNVINNVSTNNSQLHVAEVHMLNRPTFDNRTTGIEW